MKQFIMEIILQEDNTRDNSNSKLWKYNSPGKNTGNMTGKQTSYIVTEILPNVLYVSQYTIGIRNAPIKYIMLMGIK